MELRDFESEKSHRLARLKEELVDNLEPNNPQWEITPAGWFFVLVLVICGIVVWKAPINEPHKQEATTTQQITIGPLLTEKEMSK